MKQSARRRILSILLAAMLVIAGLTSCAGKEESKPSDKTEEAGVQSSAEGSGDIQDPRFVNEPEVYAFAVYVRVRSEWTLYLNDRGGLIAYAALNDEARSIEDHTNVHDGDLYDAVMDIFLVSIDDFNLNTDEEDMMIELIMTRFGEETSVEIVQRALDAANAALQERNRSGEVHSGMPENLPKENEPGDPHEPGPDEPGPAEPGDPRVEHPNFDEDRGEWVIGSAEDLDSVLEFVAERSDDSGVFPVFVSDDLTLDVRDHSYDRVDFECEAHAVTLVGNVRYGDETGSVPNVRIHNASSVDLSGLVVDMESAKQIPPAQEPRDGQSAADAYWNPQRSRLCVAVIDGTDPANVTFPANARPDIGIDESTVSMFEPILVTNTFPDGRQELVLLGPQENYAERHEKEAAVVRQCLTNGEYHSLTGQEGNNFYYVHTELAIDIGGSVLPNRDYEHIAVGRGGKLTLTGTLTITGGTLDIDLRDGGQIDLRGLTIVKAHPSPDMIHVHSDGPINEALFHCNTPSGTLHYSLSENGLSITIW